MSYEGTKCRCGDSKLSQTLICQDCEDAFSSTREMTLYRDSRYAFNLRRTSAIRLLAMASKRKSTMANWKKTCTDFHQA